SITVVSAQIFDVDDGPLPRGNDRALADLDALPAAMSIGIRIGFAGQHFGEILPLLVGSVTAAGEIDFFRGGQGLLTRDAGAASVIDLDFAFAERDGPLDGEEVVRRGRSVCIQ